MRESTGNDRLLRFPGAMRHAYAASQTRDPGCSLIETGAPVLQRPLRAVLRAALPGNETARRERAATSMGSALRNWGTGAAGRRWCFEYPGGDIFCDRSSSVGI